MIKFFDITKYKIYALLLGIITGTVVYNLISMDFYFCGISKIGFKNFFDSFLFIFLYNIKIWIIYTLVSFTRIKRKVEMIILFYIAFIFSGIIAISIRYGNLLFMTEIPTILAECLSVMLVYKDDKKALNAICSILILLIGSLLQNIFLIKN